MVVKRVQVQQYSSIHSWTCAVDLPLPTPQQAQGWILRPARGSPGSLADTLMLLARRRVLLDTLACTSIHDSPMALTSIVSKQVWNLNFKNDLYN